MSKFEELSTVFDDFRRVLSGLEEQEAKDNIEPSDEIKTYLNQERVRTMATITQVCEYIVETINNNVHDHDARIDHGVDEVEKGKIYLKAVGKCPRCTLMYFVDLCSLR